MEGLWLTKSQTTPYHPMGDGLVKCINRSILHMLCGPIDRKGTKRNIYSHFCAYTEQQNMQQLASLHMNSVWLQPTTSGPPNTRYVIFHIATVTVIRIKRLVESNTVEDKS